MGPRLVQLRRRYKLNQSQLGELCGVTKAAVSQWETGISMPEINKLVELRSKLVFSLDWLITGEEGIVNFADVMPLGDDRRRGDRRSGDRRRHDRRLDDRISNAC